MNDRFKGFICFVLGVAILANLVILAEVGTSVVKDVNREYTPVVTSVDRSTDYIGPFVVGGSRKWSSSAGASVYTDLTYQSERRIVTGVDTSDESIYSVDGIDRGVSSNSWFALSILGALGLCLTIGGPLQYWWRGAESFEKKVKDVVESESKARKAKHCPNCGNEVPPEAEYCPECGEKVS